MKHVFLILLLFSPGCYNKPQIAKELAPSCYRLTVPYETGFRLGTAHSIIFNEETYLLSAAHVMKGQVQPVLALNYKNGGTTSLAVEIKAEDKEADLVILKTTSTINSGLSLSTLPLYPRQAVYLVGTKGSVPKVFPGTIENPSFQVGEKEYILIRCSLVGAGSSGGPVCIREEGAMRVIGMVLLKAKDQEFIAAIPAKDIIKAVEAMDNEGY